MSSNPLKRFLDQLRREAAADAPGGRFFRVVFVFAAAFLVGSLLAIGRIAWALDQGAVWVNFRGSPLTRGDMYIALAMSSAAALCSIGIVVLLRKSLSGPR